VPRQAQGNSPKYEATGMAGRLADATGGTGALHVVEAIVEYRVSVWPRQTA
jgi:hypothetical protein